MQKYPARATAVGARWVNKAPRKRAVSQTESWRGGKPLLADVKFFDQGTRQLASQWYLSLCRRQTLILISGDSGRNEN